MAFIKVETSRPREMMLGIAAAYGYHEPKNPPMWWDTFWQWYLAYVALTRESRLVGTFMDTDPWQAMSWFMARAQMENAYDDADAMEDMTDTAWFDAAMTEWAEAAYNNPEQSAEVSQRVCIVVERSDAETNPWKQMAAQAPTVITSTDDLVKLGKPQPKDTDDNGAVDAKAELDKMVEEEGIKPRDHSRSTGIAIDDPKMTPEHRMALAQPGDKVSLKEPMPAKCLVGAPGSKLDDDKEYDRDAWCAAHGVNTPPNPEASAPVTPERQFGAVASEPSAPVPMRTAQHVHIDEPQDDRPVDARLADARPGDAVSIVEPVPEKCLFGAPSVLPDDDVLHADSAFCAAAVRSSDSDDDDDDEDYDDDSYDDDDGSVDDDVNAPESTIDSDLEPDDNGPSDEEIEEQQIDQDIEAQEEARREDAIEEQQIEDAIEAQPVESTIAPNSNGDAIMPGAMDIPATQPEIHVEHVDQRETELSELRLRLGRITPPEQVGPDELDRSVPSELEVDESEETKHGFEDDYDKDEG